MNQNEIAATFRAQEIQRRAARRKIILNHAKLADEELDEQTKIALAVVAQSDAEYDLLVGQLTQGYWKRLWYALINKRI